MGVKEKYTMQLELDSSKILSQYENTLRRMAALERRYLFQGSPSGPRGRRGNNSAPDRRAARQSNFGGSTGAHTMRANIRDRLQAISQTTAFSNNGPLNAELDRLDERLRSVFAKTRTVRSQRAVAALRVEYRNTTREVNSLIRSNENLNRSLSVTQQMTRRIRMSFVRIAASMGGGYAAIGAISSGFRVGKELDAMRAALSAASPTAADVGKNFAFIKSTANELGKDITALTGGFNRITIAAKGAGFSVEQSRQIFLSAAEGATAYGLDQHATSRVMLAFSQIMSKGKVSMEEISSQLGENLPGALQLGAKAMKMTDEQFIKMVSTGQMLAKDFMPAFTKELRRAARENNALAKGMQKVTANQQRMNNAFKELADDTFQQGGAKALSGIFNTIGKLVTKISPFIKNFTIGILKFVDASLAVGNAMLDVAMVLDELLGGSDTLEIVWENIVRLANLFSAAIWGSVWAMEEFNALFKKDESGSTTAKQMEENFDKVKLPFVPAGASLGMKIGQKAATFIIESMEVKADDPEQLSEAISSQVSM